MSHRAINYQSHLFYIDPKENKYLPPWFLELTSREDAEETLRRLAGSVLMRSHSTFAQTGKYAITFRKEKDSFRHYLLRNTPDGFLLEIDHKNNHPVNCLSEVMDLFVKLAGRAAQPINCENVSRSEDSSAEPLWISHKYINTPQTSTLAQLNKNVPSSPETFCSVQPVHTYLNTPQLSAASGSSKLCAQETRQQCNTKGTHHYVNAQELEGREDTYAERLSTTPYTDFRSRPTTEVDDFPQSFAPPPPPE